MSPVCSNCCLHITSHRRSYVRPPFLLDLPSTILDVVLPLQHLEETFEHNVPQTHHRATAEATLDCFFPICCHKPGGPDPKGACCV